MLRVNELSSTHRSFSLVTSTMNAVLAVLFVAGLASTYASLHAGVVLQGPGNPGAALKGPAHSGTVVGPDGSVVSGGGDAGALSAGPIPGGVVTGAVAPGGIAVGHGGWGWGNGAWGHGVWGNGAWGRGVVAVAPAVAYGGHWGGWHGW